MAAPVDLWVYVRDNRRRYHYESVQGDDMAIDETVTSDPQQNTDRVVDSLADLDPILAELGLIDLHVGRQLVNVVWRFLKLDKTNVNTAPRRERLYRIGDPRHQHSR